MIHINIFSITFRFTCEHWTCFNVAGSCDRLKKIKSFSKIFSFEWFPNTKIYHLLYCLSNDRKMKRCTKQGRTWHTMRLLVYIEKYWSSFLIIVFNPWWLAKCKNAIGWKLFNIELKPRGPISIVDSGYNSLVSGPGEGEFTFARAKYFILQIEISFREWFKGFLSSQTT